MQPLYLYLVNLLLKYEKVEMHSWKYQKKEPSLIIPLEISLGGYRPFHEAGLRGIGRGIEEEKMAVVYLVTLIGNPLLPCSSAAESSYN